MSDSDPNNEPFFVFPIEPDEDEAALSFDRLREAFANLNDDDDPEAMPEIIRLGDSSDDSQKTSFEGDALSETNAESEPEINVAPNTESAKNPESVDENGETYEPIVAAEERCELSPRTIFEAMLFVGDRDNQPLSLDRASGLMRNVSPEELLDLVHKLNASYAQSGAPYHIVEEPDGYRMALRSEFEEVRTRFYGRIRETRLSQAAIDVLAIVAYQQPVTAEDVQKLRKQPSQSILSQLVKRELLEIQRIIRDKRTVSMYRTTERFLQLFQLKSLDDIPTAEEIDYR